MPESRVISGGVFTDQRGSVRFINDFNMKEVVRFYEISPADTVQLRGWQGHKFEKKWFHCIEGGFEVNVVKIDDFENPSKATKPIKFVLAAEKPQVLCVPEGHATAFQAHRQDSRIQVFSNFDLTASKNDDFRFPLTQWSTN